MALPSQERLDEIDQELSSLGESLTSAEALLERVRSEVRELGSVDAELAQLGDGSTAIAASALGALGTSRVESPDPLSAEAPSGDPFTSTSGETVAADPFAAESEPPPPAPDAPISVADQPASASDDDADGDLDLEFPPPRPSVVPVTGMRSDVLNAELDAAIPISVDETLEAPAPLAEPASTDASTLESPLAPSMDRPLVSSAPPPIPPSRPAPRPPAPIAGARPWPPPENEAGETALSNASTASVEIADDEIEILDDDDLEMIAEPDEEEAAAASSFPPGTDPDDDAETRGFFKKLFGE